MSNSQVNPDYIIVYPAGLPGTDGKTAWEGAPYSSKANDVEFTANLLDHIQNHFCVDTSRIFATGKSNGGGFANYMACDASISGRFAAYFPVAGAYYEMGQNCSPAYKPTRIHAIHGTNDSVITFRGGEHRGAMLPYVPDWIRAWGRRNGYHHETKTLKNRTVTKFNEGCDTVLYAVHGAGHWWMSTIGYKRSKGVLQGEPTSINATNFCTRLLWEYTIPVITHRKH